PSHNPGLSPPTPSDLESTPTGSPWAGAPPAEGSGPPATPTTVLPGPSPAAPPGRRRRRGLALITLGTVVAVAVGIGVVRGAAHPGGTGPRSSSAGPSPASPPAGGRTPAPAPRS